MSFYESVQHYKSLNIEAVLGRVSEADVKRAISGDNLSAEDYLALLSKKGEALLENAAQRAYKLTRQYFGKAILLYTPLYVSNYCVNQCEYCGFNAKHKIERKKLTLKEVEAEAECISATGLKHILVLTGESRTESSFEYIKCCVEVLKKYFSSISIEVYPLAYDEYAELVAAGVDGLTVYQEVYDEEAYASVHKAGPKMDYLFRLDAAERACKAKIRTVNIGALLGLADWRKEAFLTGLHAKYLTDKYNDTDISVSVPRFQPHTGSFQPKHVVTDKNLVQIVTAVRLFLPRAGITLSTRESAELRDNLLPLGITKISAGSTTVVGGRVSQEGADAPQFEISDKRDVLEIKSMLASKGFQPVFKDWMHI